MPLCKNVQLPLVEHMEILKYLMFDNEGLVPVASFCGIVGPPSRCTNYFIDRTGNI